MYFVGWLIFVSFTDAEEQSWSKNPSKMDVNETEALNGIPLIHVPMPENMHL